MPGTLLQYQDGSTEYIPDPRSLDEQKEELRAIAGERRWNACQYFVFDGEHTQADGAISAITGALVGRQYYVQTYGVEAPDQIWKLNSHAFRVFNTTQLVTFGFAAQAHISACFNRENEISILIDGATTAEALDAINTGNWPGE